MSNSKLEALINNDLKKNITVSGFFSSYPVEEYFIEGDSAMILGRSDQLWAHIISDSETELNALLKAYSFKTNFYFSVEDWMLPLILEQGSKDWIMTTNRYILDNKTKVEKPQNEIVNLDKSYAQYIYDNSEYQAFNSTEYFEDRLSKDISCGIFKDKKPVAWGFTHDDGALGSLHVLKTHRNKGYGKDILLGLISLRRKQHRPVFGNVIPENLPSVNLLTKIGFRFDRRVSWLKLDK